MVLNRLHKPSEYDAIIVGAGVIGSAAAYTLASQGARCLLLEAQPDAIRRYAGEWMHPTVTVLMEGLGLKLPEAAARNDAGDGFIVHPEDGSEPISLPYAGGKRGFCCSHYDLSLSFREQAAAHPNVEYIPFARVIDVQRDGRVRFHASESFADQEVRAKLVVGAEGRSSICRRVLKPDSNRDVVSYMAALPLYGDVKLPREGYGHIFMGGPGLALAYRVSPEEVRVCLDVPAHDDELRRDRKRLFDAFRDALPESLREPTRAALDGSEVRWTATFFQPRTERGEDRIVLVGDAIGLCHPLCSAGVAVGLLDVTLLKEAVAKDDLELYRRSGARETWVPELMSCAVYQLLGRPDVGAALRQTVYRAWRENPAERDRTMNILTGMERRPSAFVGSFLHFGVGVLATSLGELGAALPLVGSHTKKSQAAVGQPSSVLAQLRSLERWLRWPVASVMPPWMVKRVRPHSTIHSPF